MEAIQGSTAGVEHVITGLLRKAQRDTVILSVLVVGVSFLCPHESIPFKFYIFLLSGKEVPAEFSRPSAESNWGWCNPWCDEYGGPSQAQRLQETELDVLSIQQCKFFAGSLEFNTTHEICTGKKTKVWT